MNTATQTAERPDTTEMVLVHNAFRRHFAGLPGLVGGVADGDIARAARIAGFLTELDTGLRHHHSAEDELMWPLLLERAETDSTLILRMEEQHERIAELIERADGQAARFAASAHPQTRAQLAATLRSLAAALDEHMAEEEAHILPLVERVMTVPEWEALGERGRAAVPKDRQLIFLGFILQGVPAVERRKFLAAMPFPARLAWWLLGRRAFAEEYRSIYGTDPA
ncbi:hemerythrin domain-containing protein [Nocardia arthritidis]|uniref:hemerythrin domain-containing protein n=1 Tax=Nocardia arthritidis TaxID=228602 RepID=UPI0007A3ABDC|nr:hemerythrin domain-containing protein [Nocardia arthritidis]